MRYDNVQKLTDSATGITYLRGVKYPAIPYDDNDIYIITVAGDRLDLLSNDYYNNTDDYWIIIAANNLPGDSIFVKPNTQLRIPVKVTDAKQAFNTLNQI